ncbi:Bug family tripartite tricarboxylate transporter substrate binding protein [Pontibaca salina]|uniref:Tripartite tricarboxylate transporter substrate binding protein n=1 Tax=Pontibaca salina TaxID=2795731 RepID=A0A934HRX6_9RHOB|nr:tripartite tricarboxylate transporter substrate binding protein [Pontibaca salina]MBI6629445.1 tripartite tricarboxylate transporter substrate binding protein [Pontibaca salina]
MRRILTGLAAAAMLAAGTAQAQNYPDQAITLVVPYGPGGASDLAGRALAETAREHIGQPVTVLNKPGAGGMTGAAFVSNAEPDGYTLLLARVGMALTPAVNPQSTVDWDAYTFLGELEASPMILAVKAGAPYDSVGDLVAAIEQNEGTMTYAASGATAIDGFTVQALLSDSGMDPLTAATLVPYKGGGALATALLGGHVDFLAISAGSLMPHIESGDMTPLMVFAPQRMDKLPEVPTAAELGYEQAGQITGWSALYGPKNLPEDVTAKWEEVLAKVADNETWLTLAERRGSISTVGQKNMAEYAKQQYELFHGLAQKFGYIQ